MTSEGSDPPPPSHRGGGPDEGLDRDARLAALLSVDISGPDPAALRRAVDPAAADAHPGQPAGIPGPAETVSRPRRSPWRTALSAAVLITLLGTGVGLAYAGSRIVRSSTEGRVVSPIDDPSAPGFEALVDPTETILLMHDRGGVIDALTVLTLPDPVHGGGGVLLVPTRTVSEMPIFELNPIEVSYDLGNPDFQTEVVGDLLGTGIRESAILDAGRWADLVAPVSPIVVENPNEIEVDGEVRFPLGEIRLAAEEVGPYLEARIEGESDLARLFRHEVFWRAWLGAVAEAGSVSAVPGELETGLAPFVRALAAGATVIETLPVQPAPEGLYGDDPAFVPRFEEMEDLVQRLVSFPTSPRPGARARVRILNGTGDTSEAASIAASLPPAGVEVVVIGNALTLDVEQTTVSFFGEEFRDEAEEVVEILGVGRVVEETRPSDLADITVTLGADHEQTQ